MFRAVIFDLWYTLVTWPEAESQAFRSRWSAALGVEPQQLDEVWSRPGAYERRESGPLVAALESVQAALGAGGDVDEVLGWRLDMARRALAPDPGVISTLCELRSRGIATGLISNCTEDVALVWGESPLAPLFDAAVFSARAGCMKPDPRIYELALAELGLDGSGCLFVGDGANDELGGARRVGMTPVLIHPEDEAPRWDGLESWSGLRISAIPHVLELVE